MATLSTTAEIRVNSTLAVNTQVNILDSSPLFSRRAETLAVAESRKPKSKKI